MNFKLVEVSDPVILNQIFRLRVESWRSAGVSSSLFKSDLWQDDHEDCGRHWAIFDDERLLAAARLCIHQSLSEVPHSHLFSGLNIEAKAPIASINRLVVRADCRLMGLSRKLDQVRICEAEKVGCNLIVAFCWVVSGTPRIQSLVTQGFEVVSSIGFCEEPPFGACTALVLKLPKK